ncbi:MAG: YkgJ family cysteine cluster protein [Planctomycetes bacterium]|jgi:Fe-S-cluster containining protein|nr:YkgJ family cysteine cluster protein [Planctomycetota bacterium]MDA8376828.1 YkgJ family cysteine cluster protein [Planctomycetia bacterium]
MADTPLPQYPETLTTELWYAAGLRFKCTQCGNCCGGGPGYVWLTLEDMQRMADFLHLPFTDFTRKYVRKTQGAFSLVERSNYDCIFLNRADGMATCAIYPVRPTQCRTWPFWNMNLENPAAWARAAMRCPGMGDPDSPVYSLEHIEKCRTHPESPE